MAYLIKDYITFLTLKEPLVLEFNYRVNLRWFLSGVEICHDLTWQLPQWWPLLGNAGLIPQMQTEVLSSVDMRCRDLLHWQRIIHRIQWFIISHSDHGITYPSQPLGSHSLLINVLTLMAHTLHCREFNLQCSSASY